MLKTKVWHFLSSVLLFLIIFSPFQTVYAADGIIENMNDLPRLTNQGEIARYFSTQKHGDRIVVVYNEDSDNNIGNLGLSREDFVAGCTLDERVDVLQTSGNTPTGEIINEIDSNNAVKAVDYDETVYALDVPNDRHYDLQKGIFEQVNADKTLSLGLTDQTKVAVLDTGLDTKHEDITGRFSLEGQNYYDKSNSMYDDNGHGTSVCGEISAVTNNSIGVAGFTGTNNVIVVPYKVLDDKGEGLLSYIISSLHDLNKKEDVKVINLSLGFEHENAAMRSAIVEAYQNGKILVCASGNSDAPELMFPARYDETISVGSVNSENQRCSRADWGKFGSCYGTGLDLMAPGNDIPVLDENNGYSYNAGTSFSAPVVTALVGLILETKPELNFNQVYDILTTTAQDLGPQGYDTEYGYGIVNFEQAVNKASDVKPVEYSLQCNPTQLQMAKNQVSTINTVTNSNLPIIWSSSNNSVATVSNGRVYGAGPGIAVITATLSGTNISAKVNVSVSSVDILAVAAHSQDIGWKAAVPTMEIAGTTGEHKQLEALRIGVNDPGLGINTQVHVSDVGDMNVVGKNEIAGTTGRGLGIEAVRFTLTGENAQNYSIYYRVHVENYGWTNWASEGNWNGTKGQNLQIEATQICLVPKGSAAPNIRGNVEWIFN